MIDVLIVLFLIYLGEFVLLQKDNQKKLKPKSKITSKVITQQGETHDKTRFTSRHSRRGGTHGTAFDLPG